MSKKVSLQFSNIIMSTFNLFTAGSVHQGDECFSEVSRGRQCSFMSFSALLCAQTFPIERWNTETIDEILTEGDGLYLDALRSGAIPDTEMLSLNYLPAVACWSMETNANKSPIEANKSNKSPIEANNCLF